jgi:tetratricopeptide (TPR) repeat protein
MVSQSSKKLGNEAIEKYCAALEILPDEEKQDAATINSNIAICYMKLKMYPDAIVYCDRSLEHMPLFLKPKANRAEAQFQLNNFELAVAGMLIRL